ncbi:MAG: crystallin J1 [Desulfobacteraceae bacterium]|nr:crystallin J1 [Desulfobacteraceae bacterium]
MTPIEHARLSLDGLSVGDSFGQRFFGPADIVMKFINKRILPEPPWYMTDDSIMAIGITEVLEKCGKIDQDELAKTFAENYMKSPMRGYGRMAHNILREMSSGGDWRKISTEVFSGMGSFGNGGAMRVAPLGAYFSGDLDKAAEQAKMSAEVTHAHPEGQAGAIAVAVAAAFISSSEKKPDQSHAKEILDTVIKLTPDGETRSGIIRASNLPLSSPVERAVRILGNGSKISAPDTVPFCLWCVARHIDNYEDALWTTVSGFGDRDTTCAIVGGIVSLSTGINGIPDNWINSRESLTSWSR